MRIALWTSQIVLTFLLLWFVYDLAYLGWMMEHPVHRAPGWDASFRIRAMQVAVLAVFWLACGAKLVLAKRPARAD